MTTIETSARGNVSPKDGGCWFCHKDFGVMEFSTEFDTNLHEDCLRYALKAEPNNPEAKLMLAEIMNRLPNINAVPMHSTGEQLSFELDHIKPNTYIANITESTKVYHERLAD